MSDDRYSRRAVLDAGVFAALSALAGSGQPRTTLGSEPPGPASDGSSGHSADKTDVATISPVTSALADYVAATLDRPLPPAVVAGAQLHVLDTIAAMLSGSRLKPGEHAIRYVDSLGGRPQATVIGTGIVTSVVNAAFANGMMGHADETDDTNPMGPFHAGCGVVAAVLSTAELKGRNGSEMLRAVALGYDVGQRLLVALGGTRHNPSCMTNTFAATAAAAAMLRLEPQQVRYAFSYAGQQASGIGYWDRDAEHIEKAFDFGAMGARNGVTAATMAAMGCSAVEDPFSGTPNVFTVLGDKPVPGALIADLGTRFEILNTTMKKWTVGLPLQSVLDNMAELLRDRSVRAGKIRHLVVEVPVGDIHIVDNNPNPDLCVQHLVALMIVDGGATFASVHDVDRMRDPRVLAIRRLVEVTPSAELQAAMPPHQTTVRIQTADNRLLSNHVTVVRGLASNPMDEQDVRAKALDLMGPVLGGARSSELIEALCHLDGLGTAASLRTLLQA